MGKITKIIYFIEAPFNQRDYDRFGIEILKENGFEVEIWDFTPFLNPQRSKVKLPDPIYYEKTHTVPFKNRAQNAISKLSNNCFVVCLISYRFESYPIYRSLSRNKIKYCVELATVLASSNNKKKNFLSKLKKITFTKLINLGFLYISHKYLGISPATLILASGEKSISFNCYPISIKTEILWIHSLDYDIYIREQKKIPTQVDNYIGVFIDSCLPFHPDHLTHAGLPPFTPEEYYPAICNFFDFLEKNYNVNIIIAAHPRSHHECYPDYFGRRPVIRGKTVELIRKSKFAILHWSTAVNFCVLFKKPMIFTTTNKLQQIIGTNLETMSSLFGKKVINLNNFLNIDLNENLKIDEKAYLDYKHSYIKRKGSEELPFWQVFANRVKLLNE